MKVCIIGATSQSTPGLFLALATSPALAQLRFALVARNPQRLAAITRAIGKIAPEAHFDCHDCSPAGLQAALAGADVVLLQIRYGGLAGREYDESFAVPYGIPGDEGLGPGGLSAAWRSWPPLAALLQQIDLRSQVFLLTSPGSLLTRLARAHFPQLQLRAFCELPWTTLQHAGFGLSEYGYFGINHLGWIFNQHTAVALKYWRLHDDREAFLHQQRNQKESRAAQLRRLTEAALEVYATGNAQQIREAIGWRHAPWYPESFAPLLESLITKQSPLHFFFCAPNNGWNPDFAADEILEIPFLWNNGELTRRPAGASPPAALVEKLKPFIAYERIAADTVAARDPHALEAALRLHPWVNPGDAPKLTRNIVEQNL